MGMMPAEFEAQRRSGVYRIVEAAELPFLGFTDLGHGDCQYALIRFDGDKPVEFLGSDGGAPEDQILTRDWAWVREALNAAHARGAQLTGEQQALIVNAAALIVLWRNPNLIDINTGKSTTTYALAQRLLTAFGIEATVRGPEKKTRRRK